MFLSLVVRDGPLQTKKHAKEKDLYRKSKGNKKEGEPENYEYKRNMRQGFQKKAKAGRLINRRIEG